MDYEKLYNAYYMQVYSYVMTLSKNKELAEDVTQTAFFKAMSSRSDFHGRSNELTWLCTIARNTFYDEVRRQKHICTLPEDMEFSSNDDLEKSVADSDTAYRIHVALHTLEEPYKEVFSLRVFGELPFSQIASIFAKSESWARVTYHRARIKIKERMEENDE